MNDIDIEAIRHLLNRDQMPHPLQMTRMLLDAYETEHAELESCKAHDAEAVRMYVAAEADLKGLGRALVEERAKLQAINDYVESDPAVNFHGTWAWHLHGLISGSPAAPEETKP